MGAIRAPTICFVNKDKERKLTTGSTHAHTDYSPGNLYMHLILLQPTDFTDLVFFITRVNAIVPKLSIQTITQIQTYTAVPECRPTTVLL